MVEIRINNHAIDFKLQNEKKLTDIVAYIIQWTSGRDLVVFRVEVDGEPFSVTSVPDSDVESAGVINFIIESKADVAFSAVEDGVRYCGRAVKFISNIAADDVPLSELANLKDGIDWLKGVLFSVLGVMGIDHELFTYKGRALPEYIAEMDEQKDDISFLETREKAVSYFAKKENIFIVVKEILRSLLTSAEMKKLILHSVDSPDIIISTLSSLKESLDEELQNLEDIAVAFTSGRDKDGAEKLQRFIDFIFSFSRACHHAAPVFGIEMSDVTVDGISLLDKNREIHDLLNETINVMENQDYISLSDILEYEMKPLLGDTGRYIDSILQKTEI
ncbi:MAG: hypothetical protein LBT84_07880 [Spirochaetia bacterium]|jgi:hypothetical protein|nr:hypothetical protein [Spirochaetia bacterium]